MKESEDIVHNILNEESLPNNQINSSLNGLIIDVPNASDALNNKLTSTNLYEHVNLLPKFYDGISEQKIIELQRKFKELSKSYEKTYLTLANKKKSREQENKIKNEQIQKAINQARDEFNRIQKSFEDRLNQERMKNKQLEDAINRIQQSNNAITIGSTWLFTGHPQVNSYGNGGHGRYFNNHNVRIVNIKGDGRPFPFLLGDNCSNQFGWANASMLHH